MHTLTFRSAGGSRPSLLLLLAAFISSLATVVLASSPALAAEPKVGEPAPAFEFQGVDGALHSSAELYGEKGVVVAWFPKAFTPG